MSPVLFIFRIRWKSGSSETRIMRVVTMVMILKATMAVSAPLMVPLYLGVLFFVRGAMGNMVPSDRMDKFEICSLKRKLLGTDSIVYIKKKYVLMNEAYRGFQFED
ncbi:hypothetical protein PRIC2_011286 [Phytophthora ramorum]